MTGTRSSQRDLAIPKHTRSMTGSPSRGRGSMSIPDPECDPRSQKHHWLPRGNEHARSMTGHLGAPPTRSTYALLPDVNSQ